MIPKGMSGEDANNLLWKTRSQVQEKLRAKGPYSGDELKAALSEEWHKLCGVPYAPADKDEPILMPSPENVPGGSVFPGGRPGVVQKVGPKSVQTPKKIQGPDLTPDLEKKVGAGGFSSEPPPVPTQPLTAATQAMAPVGKAPKRTAP